ncbi:MAG: PTS sugar transporter subunit IIA [Planctomycetes bacterium]|nr:PTS sugar transporter subunit IIA [Planctomycetota bacterium]
MNLHELFGRDSILTDLKAREKRAVVRELVAHLAVRENIAADLSKKIEAAVMRREARGTTGIGRGVAIPHVKGTAHVGRILAVFGRSIEGIPFESLDGQPAHLFFLVVSPGGEEENHLKVMRKIARLAQDEKSIRYLKTSVDLASLEEILKEVDESIA